MKQNKVTSWSAAIFIAAFTIIGFVPLVYLVVIGKKDGSLRAAVGDLELYNVNSHADGKFELSYGLGVLLVPTVIALVVWGVLYALARKKQD